MQLRRLLWTISPASGEETSAPSLDALGGERETPTRLEDSCDGETCAKGSEVREARAKSPQTALPKEAKALPGSEARLFAPKGDGPSRVPTRADVAFKVTWRSNRHGDIRRWRQLQKPNGIGYLS